MIPRYATNKSGSFHHFVPRGQDKVTAPIYTTVQNQKALAAYFSSKQLLPFGFAEQHGVPLASYVLILCFHLIFQYLCAHLIVAGCQEHTTDILVLFKCLRSFNILLPTIINDTKARLISRVEFFISLGVHQFNLAYTVHRVCLKRQSSSLNMLKDD